MLILLIGAKGGLGTSTLAKHLVRALDGGGVGLDLADGQLAALLDRKTWSLSGLAFTPSSGRQGVIDRIVEQRISLLWTPECALAGDAVWHVVRAVADRTTVVADGGIDPPPAVGPLAHVVAIVSADDPVAQYHEQQLKGRFPQAGVVTLDLDRSRGETKEAAQVLAKHIQV